MTVTYDSYDQLPEPRVVKIMEKTAKKLAGKPDIDIAILVCMTDFGIHVHGYSENDKETSMALCQVVGTVINDILYGENNADNPGIH